MFEASSLTTCASSSIIRPNCYLFLFREICVTYYATSLLFLCCVIISRRIITPLLPSPRNFTRQVHISNCLLRLNSTQTCMPISHKPVFRVHLNCYMLLFSLLFVVLTFWELAPFTFKLSQSSLTDLRFHFHYQTNSIMLYIHYVALCHCVICYIFQFHYVTYYATSLLFLCCVIISRRIITPLLFSPRNFTRQVHISNCLLRHNSTQTYMPIFHKPVFCVHLKCYMLLFSFFIYNVYILGTCLFCLQVILQLLDRVIDLYFTKNMLHMSRHYFFCAAS